MARAGILTVAGAFTLVRGAAAAVVDLCWLVGSSWGFRLLAGIWVVLLEVMEIMCH